MFTPSDVNAKTPVQGTAAENDSSLAAGCTETVFFNIHSLDSSEYCDGDVGSWHSFISL